jgi:gluconolactonase
LQKKLINNTVKIKVRYFITLLLILFESLLFAQSQAEKIATGFLQPEGPVWIDSLGLLFSDIKGNTMYCWSPSSGMAASYIKPSDSSNGLTLDRQGKLIICQMGQRRVVRREPDGTITPLASKFRNKRFNSPNDAVVKSDGSVFFTDPDFNVPVGQHVELGFKGIYRISTTGSVKLLDSTFDKPNGICFSPDEKKLYVNESPKVKIYLWDVINDSTISNKKLLYTIPTTGYADGMKTDSAGNIYCTGPTGIWVVSPTGTLLGKIAMSENPSNCNWGDEDRKTLYITAGKSLYKVRPQFTDVEDSKKKDNTVGEFKLFDNYPNPFNPSTVISYLLPVNSKVIIRIYSSLGEEIETLVNEYQDAGSHSALFTMHSSLPSGIYFYQLRANEFTQTKKMMVIK